MAARAGRYLPLAAGAELRLDDQGPSDAAPADPHAADWMRNVLHAREMRLDAFAAELGRYRPGLLRCDPAVAPLRFRARSSCTTPTRCWRRCLPRCR